MERVQGLKDGLTIYGVPNLGIRVCNAQGSPKTLAECARDFEAEGARALITVGGVETQTALRSTHRIPILYVGLAASLDWGFIQSLRRPGGRVSGVDNGYAELTGKRLEWLVRALPSAHRVLVLYQPEVVPTPKALTHLRSAASILGTELAYFEVRHREDLNRLPQVLANTQPDAALLLPSFILENALTTQVLPALEATQVPLVGLSPEHTRAGAALSYGASEHALGQQAARMLKKLLEGLPISELPVERPDIPRLTLNRRVLERLGYSPTPQVAALADEL